MRIRKSYAVAAFAGLFGGNGFAFGCVAAFVLGPHRGPSVLPYALLTIAAFVGASALLGAGVGLLFARLSDPPDPPSRPNE